MLDTSLPRTLAVIHQGLAAGLHVGAQLYVSRRGRVVADLALGLGRAGVEMSPETLMIWLSATKPLVAVALAQLWELGRLELDDPVARHIPEFAAQGKEAVTIRHLLTHTGGFRRSASNWNPAPWEALVARICASPLESGWIPGQKAGYHIASSWVILGELIGRIDGRPVSQYMRQEIFLPLGMNDCWLGMSPEVYRGYGQRIGLMHDTSHHPPQPHVHWDTEASAALVRPGASGRGPIRQLGRFYEMLLNHGRVADQQILRPQTVEALVARHRSGMFDETFQHVLDWGLGFLVNSRQYGEETVPYGYGPHASQRTFGHGGSQSSAGYADPEHGLAVAFVFNGTPGEKRHQERIRALNRAIYEDLGLG